MALRGRHRARQNQKVCDPGYENSSHKAGAGKEGLEGQVQQGQGRSPSDILEPRLRGASGSALVQSLLDGFPDDDFVGAAERLASLKFELEAKGVFSEVFPSTEGVLSEVPSSTSCHR